MDVEGRCRVRRQFCIFCRLLVCYSPSNVLLKTEFPGIGDASLLGNSRDEVTVVLSSYLRSLSIVLFALFLSASISYLKSVSALSRYFSSCFNLCFKAKSLASLGGRSSGTTGYSSTGCSTTFSAACIMIVLEMDIISLCSSSV